MEPEKVGNSKMRSVIQSLLDSTRAMNKEVRDEAILQIAMLLERSSITNPSPGSFVGILREDLSEVILDESEQHTLVQELKALCGTKGAGPGILWAIGKARWEVGLQPLLEIIHNQEIQFDEVATWQALIALDNFLSSDVEIISDNRSSVLKAYNLVPWLESARLNSQETATRNLAKLLIEKVRGVEE